MEELPGSVVLGWRPGEGVLERWKRLNDQSLMRNLPGVRGEIQAQRGRVRSLCDPLHFPWLSFLGAGHKVTWARAQQKMGLLDTAQTKISMPYLCGMEILGMLKLFCRAETGTRRSTTVRDGVLSYPRKFTALQKIASIVTALRSGWLGASLFWLPRLSRWLRSLPFSS